MRSTPPRHMHLCTCQSKQCSIGIFIGQRTKKKVEIANKVLRRSLVGKRMRALERNDVQHSIPCHQPPATRATYSAVNISRKRAEFNMTRAQTRDAHAMEQSISPPDARNDSPLSDESLAVRKRRIKAHRKSRGGCLMCKTRKVKVSDV